MIGEVFVSQDVSDPSSINSISISSVGTVGPAVTCFSLSTTSFPRSCRGIAYHNISFILKHSESANLRRGRCGCVQLQAAQFHIQAHHDNGWHLDVKYSIKQC